MEVGRASWRRLVLALIEPWPRWAADKVFTGFSSWVMERGAAQAPRAGQQQALAGNTIDPWRHGNSGKSEADTRETCRNEHPQQECPVQSCEMLQPPD